MIATHLALLVAGLALAACSGGGTGCLVNSVFGDPAKCKPSYGFQVTIPIDTSGAVPVMPRSSLPPP